MTLKDRVAIVTGAARGIGLATARRLAAEGAAVLMADYDIEETRRAAANLSANGLRVHALKTDVSNRADVEAMTRAARDRLGEIDILVNNAGIAGHAAPLEEITDRDWDQMMDID